MAGWLDLSLASSGIQTSFLLWSYRKTNHPLAGHEMIMCSLKPKSPSHRLTKQQPQIQ